MKQLSVNRIEEHRLSDGRLTTITKLGRKYTFMITSLELLEAPYMVFDLNKGQAYDMLADTLRNDVLDLVNSFNNKDRRMK